MDNFRTDNLRISMVVQFAFVTSLSGIAIAFALSATLSTWINRNISIYEGLLVGAVSIGYIALHVGLLALVWRTWRGVTRQAQAIDDANRDLKVANTQMEESEARFRKLFDEAPVGYHEVDTDGHITRVNRTELDMLGYAADEVLGRPLWEFVEEPEIVREEFFKQVNGTIETGSAYERMYRKKDGTLLPVLADTPLLRDNEGHVIGARTTVQDITELKEVQERLQETSRLASVGELAAGVAHELNNPLGSIMGFTELLLDEDLPQSARDDLQTVYSDVQRAARIVQNLQSFARRDEPTRQYVDVTDVVQKALEIKSYHLRVNNVQVTTRFAKHVLYTMLDEHQVLQVIVNILGNAEQAIVGANRDGRISIDVSRSGDQIKLTIADDGPGMAPETLKKVFHPFFTTKEVGEGTGLGLSICYGIVKQHGGDLWAESVPGEGATFHITLPVSGPDGDMKAPDSEEVREATTVKRILVVDDERGIRAFLSGTLESEGHSVETAQDGKEALEKVRGAGYDHIIMDLHMPGVDGERLYQLIHEFDEGLASRIIFVTGDTLSPHTHKFVFGTGNPALTKPFSREDLQQALLLSEEVTPREDADARNGPRSS